ncbi:MAG: hypothetical protein M1501_03010 [Candidatus Omnitrophica bacterium]|nr:hypothetical protein [Candidatus Omnitrophota bacterium]
MEKERFHLYEPHKRSITSSLCYVEELLSEIESSLYNKKGIFFETINNINGPQCEKIKFLIKNIIHEIEKVKKELHLEKNKIMGSNVISSRCVAIWETLHDMESQKLKKYGNIQKEFSEYFDPIVKKLLEYNEEILTASKPKK